ncbi:hypothetical protein SAMN04487969_101125 [Paenibacillus algorifonticola]|uniref:Uncharacterized protein n=1 Tax=Paenibacillus algorifonticola TaxID=684063 RepID=A0A1I1XVN6_9BACL|nr:hypothetical protein [Paenibacillus algorifonticola]SFE11415.1 hypothetical protein SAMN04487969_101125 [Paenibacillus algorifonticola]
MAYATAADYEQYGNGSIPTEALDKELQLASDQVDSLTYNRIVGRGLVGLSTYQQTSVIKAVCQQADFSYQYGDFLTMPIAGYSAGSVSLSFKTVEGAGGVQTTESVVNLLRATGLTNRGLC